MTKNKFVFNSILLIFVNLIIRFISFTHDALLYKKIGPEAMGLFHMVMPLLMFCLMFTTAGIPTAVSRLILEYSSIKNHAMVQRVLRVALTFLLVMSTLLAILLILLVKFIAFNILKNKDSLYFLYLLVPAFIAISITSSLRAYYYGINKMVLASSSEIIEHVSRFVFILGFLYFIKPRIGPFHGALVGILGISLGEVFDLVYLLLLPKPHHKKTSSSRDKMIPYLLP